MTFHAGEILVFDKAGNRIGLLDTWSVSVPRSYSINEIEDFAITIPLLRDDGSNLIHAAMDALLQEDNLVYVGAESTGLPGWGGYGESVNYGDEMAEVKFLGGPGLLSAIQCDRIA